MMMMALRIRYKAQLAAAYTGLSHTTHFSDYFYVNASTLNSIESGEIVRGFCESALPSLLHPPG
jgi:hypothetical protein